ncbi:membrane protein involved in the export of O-antigen and teichoic acid [Desulfosporosinus orientis DSM 765]|uniref:Membrane protein involved in the export of O-antigen and teichoic acid n=1 Tax=Desulfosporosinus orientis (strain ATCC 19365 / DSM 765 / NCIMB 8382 / VKM B-1628 / Singapore I) TaxID=768706 RepID=G7W765_DESOD|nr:oligosaccharide flippase family protein [Desulfosporosinus orientis]AET70573.1 membrane protein involved in the export of O-antigen and teichoic acid [Desulfosporosinus orientis DSM 765]
MRRTSLSDNTILLMIGTILSKGLMFIMVPFFSRWLTTEDYGTFDLYISYASLLVPIISLSSGEGLFRYMVEDNGNGKMQQCVSDGLIITVVGFALLTIVTSILYLSLGWQMAWPFWLLLSSELWNKYLQSFLRGIKRLDIYSYTSAISVIFIAIAVTVFVKVLEMSLSGIVIGYGLGYSLGCLLIIVWSKYPKYVSVNTVSLLGAKKLITYSYKLIANSISWWVMNVSDRIIISVILGAATNGVYAIANKIPAIVSSVISMFSISWQQSASEMYRDENRSSYYNSIFQKLAKITLTFSACLLSVNFILFDYVFDIKYSSGRFYSPILLTAIVFFTLSNFMGGIQISLFQPENNSRSAIVGAIVNVLLTIALINVIGLYAPAFATLISYAVTYFIRQYKLRRIVRFQITPLIVWCVLYYVYFVIMALVNANHILNTINIIVAILAFILINKELFNKYYRRMRRLLISKQF